MNELTLLLFSAASLGFIHTLLGPDHYLPFIVLSKAQHWSTPKTMWVTFFSGIGHVGSSILIGTIGIVLGFSLSKLESLEAFRGDFVSWMLFAFGVLYTLYGIYKYFKHSHHSHLPSFLKPKAIKDMEHLPMDEKTAEKTKVTPWILFLIFIFGPCEVLIPLLLFPAYEYSTLSMLWISLVFAIATISTMLVMVYLGHKGFSLLRMRNHERYAHLLAGVVILISASGMLFLGW